jgi:hypothetical protein
LDPGSLFLGASFLIGMIVSIAHVFTQRRKTKIEKEFILFFTVIVTTIAGISAGSYAVDSILFDQQFIDSITSIQVPDFEYKKAYHNILLGVDAYYSYKPQMADSQKSGLHQKIDPSMIEQIENHLEDFPYKYTVRYYAYGFLLHISTIDLILTKKFFLLLFPFWNILNAFILLSIFRARFLTHGNIKDDNISIIDALVSACIFLLIFFVCHFLLKLYWALTFSICVAYAINISKPLINTFFRSTLPDSGKK